MAEAGAGADVVVGGDHRLRHARQDRALEREGHLPGERASSGHEDVDPRQRHVLAGDLCQAGIEVDLVDRERFGDCLR